METPLRIALFILVVSVIATSVHVYLYRRLFRDTSTSPAWRHTGKVLLTLLCLPLLLSWVVTRVIPSAFIVAVYAWTWMGVAVYRASRVLHRHRRAHADDVERARHPSTRSKRTRSPSCNAAPCSGVKAVKSSAVPMRFHPPGEAKG